MEKDKLFRQLKINEKLFIKYVELMIKHKIQKIISVQIYFEKDDNRIIECVVLDNNEIIKVNCVCEVEKGSGQ